MRYPNIDNVIAAAAVAYGVTPDYIIQDTRKKEVVRIRQVTQYICKGLTNESLEFIGSKTGGKDHATILHSVKTVDFQKDHYGDVAMLINNILRVLKRSGFELNKPKPTPKLTMTLNGKADYIHCPICGGYLSLAGKCGKCKTNG